METTLGELVLTVVEGLVNLCGAVVETVTMVPGLGVPGEDSRCPVDAITLGELVLTPAGLVNLCPVVGVPPRGVPEGLANLDPCAAAIIMAGELVLTPAEVTMTPEVPGVDGILCPVVGVLVRGVPEGLANLDPCAAAITMAAELVLTPAEVTMPPEVPGVDGILCPVVGVLVRGVPEGLANLEPCAAVVTTAGELVLTPAEVTMAPEVTGVDGILCPVVGVLVRGVPEGLANLEPCPAVVTMAGELVLTPPEVTTAPDVYGSLCPVVGVPARGVPERFANLEPCPAVVTTAGELVLTPPEVTTAPDVYGSLCPVVGVPARGMPEALANLDACPAVTMAGELVLTPAEVTTPPWVDGSLCLAADTTVGATTAVGAPGLALLSVEDVTPTGWRNCCPVVGVLVLMAAVPGVDVLGTGNL